MKSTLIALFLLAACSTMSYAQCEKTVVLNSSHTQHTDAAGTTQETVDEKSTIELNKTDITVNLVNDNGTEKLNGKIKSETCDWKTPFKEGKMVVTTTLNSDNGGDPKDFTITVEGKDGKITLTAESPAMPDRKIRLDIEKFEEKK